MSATKARTLVCGGDPQVVGTFATAEALVQLVRAKGRAFDIAEVRADLMGLDAAGCLRLCRRVGAAGAPLLLTVRRSQEGGKWKGGEAARFRFYQKVLPAVSAVDVEIRSGIFKRVAASARQAGRVVIGSFHDFLGAPSTERLRELIASGRDGGADIVKIATRIRDAGDFARLEQLARDAKPGTLAVVSMGPGSLARRVRLVRAGSCLTYGYVDGAAAPGQPSARALRAALRR